MPRGGCGSRAEDRAGSCPDLRSRADLNQGADGRSRSTKLNEEPLQRGQASGKIELDPDLRVREAIGLVFARFAEMQSIRQVFLSLRADRIALPYIDRKRLGSGGRSGSPRSTRR